VLTTQQIVTLFYLARLASLLKCQRHFETRAANVWDLVKSSKRLGAHQWRAEGGTNGRERNEGGQGGTIPRAPNHYGGTESLLGIRRNFSKGGNVDILLMVFRLLAKQYKRTFAKHFTLSKPQRKCTILGQ